MPDDRTNVKYGRADLSDLMVLSAQHPITIVQNGRIQRITRRAYETPLNVWMKKGYSKRKPSRLGTWLEVDNE